MNYVNLTTLVCKWCKPCKAQFSMYPQMPSAKPPLQLTGCVQSTSLQSKHVKASTSWKSNKKTPKKKITAYILISAAENRSMTFLLQDLLPGETVHLIFTMYIMCSNQICSGNMCGNQLLGVVWIFCLKNKRDLWHISKLRKCSKKNYFHATQNYMFFNLHRLGSNIYFQRDLLNQQD